MQSYFPRLLVTFSATTALLLGCGGGATPTGSGGSSTSASTATGAGGGASTSTATGVGGATATGTGGATASGTGAGGSVAFACSGAVVGYAADVASIFNGCSSGDTCHALANGFQTAASSYAYLVGKTSFGCMDGRLLVAPGDPEHSYLINKLTNHELCSGSPMPKGKGPGAMWIPRSDADIQTIYDWICTGAKND